MKRLAISAALCLLAAAPLRAQEINTVHFKSGQGGAVIAGQIKGDRWIGFRLGAAAGQTMRIGMTASNAAAYFNLFAPGSGPGDAALFIGSTGGPRYEGTLPASGDYTIQVYLMRSAARRGESASFKLTVSIGGAAAPAPGRSASGKIPCKYGPGAPTTQCDFTVSRAPGGEATVHVMLTDGGQRYIYFKDGKVTSADSDAAFSAHKESDLTILELKTGERYEIPDAVISGG